MSKEYVCNSCGEVMKNPHEVKMKEFYIGCSFENFGVLPSLDKRKSKIHLCDRCFMGLRKIAEKAVPEWISVKDRLPEVVSTHKRYRSTIKKSIRVLCVCVQKSGKTMVKEGYCEWYNDYPEPRWQIPGTIDDVTHWMPLPQPPKGE